MHVDPEIEQHVRDAFAAVIGRDGERFAAAFEGLDRDQSVAAATYGVVVVGYVVNSLFREGYADQQLRDLAARIVDGEKEWADLDLDTVVRLLGSASAGDLKFPGVPREDVLGYLFVCGGYLLGIHRREGQEWWEYLDQIWAVTAAVSERS